ncbi:MAG: ABC transporter substrate-binding protein [Clostridia bacterium]|nr:ABC transporter substrate-binding protein [Clostridia bacterium]
MKKTSKLLSILLVVMLLSGCLFGCADTSVEQDEPEQTATEAPVNESDAPVEPSDEADPTEEPVVEADYLDKVVTVGQISTWGLLCPFAVTDSYSQFIYDVLYEKLVFVNGDYTISPRAADSWEMNEDSTVWTFHLNQDAKWHDGTPLTAHDWVFAAQTITDPNFVSGRKSMYANFEGTDADGNETSENSVAWVAVDDFTLQVTLKATAEITAFFIANNNGIYPLPKHLLEGIDTATLLEDSYWTNPVGCGVGIFDSQVEGSTITFKTNQEYYRGAPKFGTLVFRVVAQDSMAAAFMAGELDLCFSGLNYEDAAAAALQPNVNEGYTELAYALCWMNINIDKLNDVKLRQAVRYCINQEAISQVLFGGQGVISASPTLQVGDYYTDSIEYASEYNPEKAKALFDEAGWDYNETFIIGAPSGTREDAATIIAQSLESIGIKVEIQVNDATTTFANAKEGKYHVSLQSTSAWTNDPLTTRASMNTYIHTYGTSDVGTELNGILDQMSMELDLEKRAELARQWLVRCIELCPIAPVYRTRQYMLTSARVTGWSPDNQAVGFNNNWHDLIVD